MTGSLARLAWTVLAICAMGFSASGRVRAPAQQALAGGLPAAVMYHGVNQTLLQACMAKHQNCTQTVPGLAQCMTVHRRCSCAVPQKGWLTGKVPPGTPLLTAKQVLAGNGIPGPNIKRATAVLTTYGALHRQDPALAASATISPDRPVYLVTEWFIQPEVVDISAPQGVPAQGTVTSEQLVVDAVTGQVTDYTP